MDMQDLKEHQCSLDNGGYSYENNISVTMEEELYEKTEDSSHEDVDAKRHSSHSDDLNVGASSNASDQEISYHSSEYNSSEHADNNSVSILYACCGYN